MSSSSGQKISDPAFQKFENTIETVSTDLSANLKSLADAVATVQAAWTGSGAGAFQKAQVTLNEDHDALRRLIDGIHEAVTQTRKYGGANDQHVLSSFNRIDVNGDAAGGHLAPGAGGSGLGAGLETGSKISGY